jgi:hypothetical protein
VHTGSYTATAVVASYLHPTSVTFTQTVSVTPNTTYDIGFYTAYDTTQDSIGSFTQIFVNGQLITRAQNDNSDLGLNQYDIIPQAGTWLNIDATWNSGSATTATAKFISEESGLSITACYDDFYVKGLVSLFTTKKDIVDFNSLKTDQISAINGDADLYNGMGGGDTITLPNANPGDNTVSIAGTNKTFDLTQTFVLGDTAGQNTILKGNGGSYNILLGDGSDTVTLNGNGSSNITAGSGDDTISIKGSGNNVITGGSGNDKITINGGGNNTIKIGAGGTVELTSTTVPVAGSITFTPDAVETLQIDGVKMPTSVINGFVDPNGLDTIDLTGVPFDSAGATLLEANNTLQIVDKRKTYNLTLDPSQDYSGYGFDLSRDAAGTGTKITVGKSKVSGGKSVGAAVGTFVTGYSTSSYPYNSVVFIQAYFPNGETLPFTGFIVNSHTILTVSHGFWNAAGQEATQVVISGSFGSISLANGQSSIAGNQSTINFGTKGSIQTGMIGFQAPGSVSPNDYAIIHVSQTLPSKGFPIGNYSTGATNITGYPTPNPNNPQYPAGTQFNVIGGTLTPFSSGLLQSKAPTEIGNSGSPVWVYNGSSVEAVGILEGGNGVSSVVVPITSALTEQINDKPETPTLNVPRALTVVAGKSVPLGVVVTGIDSDDVLSIKISGVPSFESISASGVTPIVTGQQGGLSTYTFNALPVTDWNNGLILHSTYAGTGTPTNSLTVTVSNAEDSSTAPAKTIKVTDPPAGNDGSGLRASDGMHFQSLALLGQYMASSFVIPSDGHGGTMMADPLTKPAAAPEPTTRLTDVTSMVQHDYG